MSIRPPVSDSSVEVFAINGMNQRQCSQRHANPRFMRDSIRKFDVFGDIPDLNREIALIYFSRSILAATTV